ncbi:uncharacterized protein LOC106639533 isoform X1 [Copidosoma floridanum]|uniref:uncharacterized protein LOC106639533 isoform X1 n=1 Tax=Copidosoma floridanum TaxID=29053 RepID=UPI0006C97A34|nr:uncharacterized protein LOC106639533 isoform X1 [Copidosoma floridanum]
MGPSTGLVNRSFLYSCAKPQQSPVSGGADNATGNDKLVHALDGPRLHRLSMPRVAPIKLELMALPKPKSASSATSCESIQTSSLVASANAEKRKSKTEVASKANLRLTPENESSGDSVKNSKLTLKKKYQKHVRKAQKLKSKSVSSKSLDSSIKNLTISEPCNFVHVVSLKNGLVLNETKLNPITRKDNSEDVEDNVYAEIALRDEKEEEDQKIDWCQQ